MSSDVTEQEDMSGTRPEPEHAWLQKLVGTWRVESEMMMPGGESATSTGTETVIDFGGLWALGEGRGQMPNGESMEYRTGLGFDVSYKEYRGFWMANVSSHLWKYTGELSADGKTMTLSCVGPNMMGEGEANYRDVIELQDENHRTLTSYGQQEDGSWAQFMKASYTRA